MMEAKTAAWNLGRSFQRFAKNTAARRGRASVGWSGSKKVVRCRRSALGRGQASVVRSGDDGQRGLVCRLLVPLRLLRKGNSGRVVVGAERARWPREHGVCPAWAHNVQAAQEGCLGADGRIGEFGHRFFGSVREGGGDRWEADTA